MAQSSDSGFGGRSVVRNGNGTTNGTKQDLKQPLEKETLKKPLKSSSPTPEMRETRETYETPKKLSSGVMLASEAAIPSTTAALHRSLSAEITSTKAPAAPAGIHVERRKTTAGADPLDTVVYERRSSIITNPDGSIVFKMEGAEIPAGWSQLATDIVISKYSRKAGLFGDKAPRGGRASVRS